MKHLAKITKELNKTFIENLEKMEKSQVWEQPFVISHPWNPITENIYSGFNRFILSNIAYNRKLKSSAFLTFNQIKSVGGKINKGAKGIHLSTTPTKIYFFENKKITQKQYENLSEEEKLNCDVKHFCGTFTVFSIEDTNLNPEDYKQVNNQNYFIEDIESFVNNIPAEIYFSETFVNPCYVYGKETDKINMLPLSNFKSTEEYYATLFHELSHWTGNEKRLNRFKTGEKETKKEYAFEELVAEISSTYLCSYFNISSKRTLNNNLSYVSHWIQLVKEDENVLLKAFHKAEESTRYLLNYLNNNLLRVA